MLLRSAPSFAPGYVQPASRHEERRAGPRVAIATDVILGAQGRELTALSNDISTRGLFVAAYQTIPEGTRVSVRLRLPTGHVISTGVVRWTRAARPGVLAGMGIEQTDLDQLDKVALERFCVDEARLLSRTRR